MPRLAAPAAHALRWLALARLRAGWTAGRVDLELPSGQWVRIGGPGRADLWSYGRGSQTLGPMLSSSPGDDLEPGLTSP